MIEYEIENRGVLSEEQQKLISSNIGLLDAFYKNELGKGYIPDQKRDDFFSNLQQRFCSAALKYDKDAGFKFSTFAYGSFIFCVVDTKKKLFRDRKIKNAGIIEEFLTRRNDDTEFSSYGDKSTWNSIDGWDVDSIVNREEMIILIDKVSLSEKERAAVNFYYFENFTLLQTGKEMGLSRQRVKQLTSEAIVKVKRFVDRRDYEMEDFIESE